jgi:hypothetical protein
MWVYVDLFKVPLSGVELFYFTNKINTKQNRQENYTPKYTPNAMQKKPCVFFSLPQAQALYHPL